MKIFWFLLLFELFPLISISQCNKYEVELNIEVTAHPFTDTLQTILGSACTKLLGVTIKFKAFTTEEEDNKIFSEIGNNTIYISTSLLSDAQNNKNELNFLLLRIAHHIGHHYQSNNDKTFEGVTNPKILELYADWFSANFLIECGHKEVLLDKHSYQRLSRHPIDFSNHDQFLTFEERLCAIKDGAEFSLQNRNSFPPLLNYDYFKLKTYEKQPLYTILMNSGCVFKIMKDGVYLDSIGSLKLLGSSLSLNTKIWHYWNKIQLKNDTTLYFDAHLNVCNDRGIIVGRVIPQSEKIIQSIFEIIQKSTY